MKESEVKKTEIYFIEKDNVMREIAITDIEAIRIGQAENKDGGTGCTVLISEKGCASDLGGTASLGRRGFGKPELLPMICFQPPGRARLGSRKNI